MDLKLAVLLAMCTSAALSAQLYCTQQFIFASPEPTSRCLSESCISMEAEVTYVPTLSVVTNETNGTVVYSGCANSTFCSLPNKCSLLYNRFLQSGSAPGAMNITLRNCQAVCCGWNYCNDQTIANITRNLTTSVTLSPAATMSSTAGSTTSNPGSVTSSSTDMTPKASAAPTSPTTSKSPLIVPSLFTEAIGLAAAVIASLL